MDEAYWGTQDRDEQLSVKINPFDDFEEPF